MKLHLRIYLATVIILLFLTITSQHKTLVHTFDNTGVITVDQQQFKQYLIDNRHRIVYICRDTVHCKGCKRDDRVARYNDALILYIRLYDDSTVIKSPFYMSKFDE